jgi:hypothetical protein
VLLFYIPQEERSPGINRSSMFFKHSRPNILLNTLRTDPISDGHIPALIQNTVTGRSNRRPPFPLRQNVDSRCYTRLEVNLSSRLINYALRPEDEWGSGVTVPRTLNLDTWNHKIEKHNSGEDVTIFKQLFKNICLSGSALLQKDLRHETIIVFLHSI